MICMVAMDLHILASSGEGKPVQTFTSITSRMLLYVVENCRQWSKVSTEIYLSRPAVFVIEFGHLFEL